MLSESELKRRLENSENHWVERKQSFHPQVVKETMVAFANSVPENEYAVLFIGVGPDGTCHRVEKADEKQRSVRRIAEDECFPAISCSPTALLVGNVEILAVVIGFSKDRPHFAGLPFVRVGSETIRDRLKLNTLLEDLIASRNDKARRLLREKGNLVSVISIWPPLKMLSVGSRRSPLAEAFAQIGPRYDESECRIEHCDAFVVRFVDITTGQKLSSPLEKVTIGYDEEKHRLELTIDCT